MKSNLTVSGGLFEGKPMRRETDLRVIASSVFFMHLNQQRRHERDGEETKA